MLMKLTRPLVIVAGNRKVWIFLRHRRVNSVPGAVHFLKSIFSGANFKFWVLPGWQQLMVLAK